MSAPWLLDWPAQWAGVLQDEPLTQAAGSPQVWGRALQLLASQALCKLDEDPMPEPALRANLRLGEGRQAHECHTEIWIENDALAGQCSCQSRSAATAQCCEHQLALALLWRQRRTLGRPQAHTPVNFAHGKQAQHSPELAALSHFLHSRPAAELVAKLLALAERDVKVQAELHHWRELVLAPELVPIQPGLAPGVAQQLAQLLQFNKADRYPDANDYGDDDEPPDSYANRVWHAVELLQQARLRNPVAAVNLCVQALLQIWQAFDEVDDALGEVFDAGTGVLEELVSALQNAGDTQPSGFGTRWLALQLADDYGCIGEGVVDAVEDAMSARSLSDYRNALAEQWQAQPPTASADAGATPALATAQPEDIPSDWQQELLNRLLLRQLRLTGRVDEGVALLRERLRDVPSHTQLIEFLQACGRWDDALTQAQQSLVQHPNQPPLEALLLQALEHAGLASQVQALRHLQFARNPTLDGFHRVMAAAQAVGLSAADGAALTSQLLADAQAREQEPPDVSLRVAILLDGGHIRDAHALLTQPGHISTDVMREQVALALPASLWPQALNLLELLFAKVIASSASPHEAALRLAGHILARLSAPERLSWLREARRNYAHKRNFLRDLPDA